MVLNFSLPSPLQRLLDPALAAFGVDLWIKRDDLIHPQVSGNKWRKLKYNVDDAQKKGFTKILTFGGAFSNHIYATAAAGQIFGLETIGIIRGERVEPLNSTLTFAETMGMKLHFVNRETYRKKSEPAELEKYEKQFGPVYMIPEGGANTLGVKGCEEILPEIEIPFDFICCACGTGTTLAGLINSLGKNQQAIGFPILKAETFMENEVHPKLIQIDHTQFSLNQEYHFGGYAKWNTELEQFMDRFEKIHNMPLEPVYTGKLFYGIYDLIKKKRFPEGSRVILLHTGGLR